MCEFCGNPEGESSNESYPRSVKANCGQVSSGSGLSLRIFIHNGRESEGMKRVFRFFLGTHKGYFMRIKAINFFTWFMVYFLYLSIFFKF